MNIFKNSRFAVSLIFAINGMVFGTWASRIPAIVEGACQDDESRQPDKHTHERVESLIGFAFRALTSCDRVESE